MGRKAATAVSRVLAFLAIAVGTAEASITPMPSSVTAFQTQLSPPVSLSITFPPATSSGTGTVDFTGQPTGVGTFPSPVTFSFAAGATSASTSFQFSTAAATPAGTYNISMSARPPNLAAGTGTVTLVVQEPAFTATSSPNPVSLTRGGASQSVTLSTTPDPGMRGAITYSYGGFPAGVSTGTAQTVSAPYPNLTFSFSAAATVPPGTYNGTLTAQYTNLVGVPRTRTFPMTVIVLQPDIAVSFAQPTMTVCNPGPAVGNSVTLTPVNGYSGRAVLTFTAPAGVTVSPPSDTSNAMPPPYTLNFLVSASAPASGPQTVNLNVRDTGPAGINKNVTLTVNVFVPDYTPSVTPPSLSIQAGGAAGSFTASLSPNACFTASSVTVTPSGAPGGVTSTPASVTLPGPGFPAMTFSFQAARTVTPGTYPITFTFTPVSGAGLPGVVKTVTASLVVTAATDFTLSASPPAVSIAPGGPASTTTVTATPLNGFTGTINVTTVAGGLTVAPNAFTLTVSGPPASQAVAISAPTGTAPGSYTVTFSGNDPVVGTRTTSVTVVVGSGTDFSLSAAPPTLSVAPGAFGTTTVTATPLNGFIGPITVTAVVTGLSVSPNPFTLNVIGPPESQVVSISVPTGTPVGTYTVTFSGNNPSVGTRTTSVNVVVAVSAPNFSLSASPTSLSLAPGGPAGTTTVTAASINGFTGTVAVTTAASGLTVSPDTFTLSLTASGPPASQAVAISASSGTAPGTYTVTFSGNNPNVGTRTASVTVAVGSAPDFSLSVTSSTPTLGRGGTTTVTVAAAAINLFTGSITVTAPTIAGIVFSPASFSLLPGASQLVTLTASATAPLGTFVANFTGTAAGVPGQRVASFTLTIGAEPPVITEVVPPAVARGVRSAVVRLIGFNFQTGAVVTGGTDLTIEQTTVFSPTLAEILVTTRSDAPPGPRRLDLRNPDGGTTPGDAFVLVYPESSLVAPFGVTAAAIVFPRPGSFVAFDEAVYPRGLLATTGTGILIGSWLFDGVPFERFTAPVTGGHPIEVWSRVPIPISFAGRHQLTLAVETPQQLLSTPVPIVQVVQRASRLKIYAPRDGAVIGKAPPLFRWSILPGASGYEVLFEDAPPALPKRIRVSQAEWRPTQQDLQQIGPGVHRWRVRPVFPVEVQGEPTPSQRVALLPETVSIAFLPAGKDSATGRTLLRWQGGSPGLLYRVDFFKGNERVPAFSALTAKQEYLLPAGSPYGSAGYRVRVTAYGPDGTSLGGSEIQNVPASAFSPSPGSGFQLAQAPVAVLRREPAEGAIVTTDRPRIAAQWSGAVTPDQIALAIDTTDVTAVSQMTPSAIAYEPLVPLSPGPHTVRLSLAGALTSWRFTVQPGAPSEKPPAEGPPAETPAPGPGEEPTEPAPSVPPEEAAGQRTDWAVTALGTLTVISGNAPDETDDARAQLSSQGDLGNESLSGKLNGDISWRHQISEPQSTIQESRSWLAQAAAQQGKFRQEAVAGYAAPSFLDQTELMTAGLARGGIEGRFLSPAGSLAYYETFDSKPAGVVAGNSGPEQKIRVGAFSTPGDPNRFLLRAIALKVEDSASEFSPGGEGEAFGLFGKYTLGPAFSVLFEGARGDFKPRAGSMETERRGYAYRLALLGTAGTFSYNVNARLTEADFVNPANRGFTPGGVADRRGGDVSLTKAFGRTSLALQYRHLEGGNSSGSVTPDAREDGGSLTVNTGIGSKVTISASGNVTTDSADADEANQLPRTDRTQSGWTVTVNETPGAITFSQAFAYQRLRDEVNPSSDTTVKTASINAAGALGSYLNLSGIISGTRSDGIPQIGRTDQVLFSLQPSFAIPALWLSLQPRASYTRSENEVTALDSRTEQYQFMLLWAPTWAQSLVNLQFSADWNRTRNKGQIGGTGFMPRYATTLTLRWGAGRGPAAPGGTVLPGETPIAPSSEAAAMQAGDTTATPAPTGGGP